MKAAVMRTHRSPLALEEMGLDEPGPGEVLVRTVASGICHSDFHVLEGHLPVPPPCVLGHEPAGIVERVGTGVSEFARGDHVIGCLTSTPTAWLEERAGSLDTSRMSSCRVSEPPVHVEVEIPRHVRPA